MSLPALLKNGDVVVPDSAVMEDGTLVRLLRLLPADSDEAKAQLRLSPEPADEGLEAWARRHRRHPPK